MKLFAFLAALSLAENADQSNGKYREVRKILKISAKKIEPKLTVLIVFSSTNKS